MGNIFSGKTTTALALFSYFQQCGKQVLLILEPVEKWKYPLYKYYSCPTTQSCFQMQSAAYHHHAYSTIEIKETLENNNETIVIIERCPQENLAIFCKHLAQQLGQHYYQLLESLTTIQINDEVWINATYLYLCCSDINTLLNRQTNRITKGIKNTGDDMISKEYLQQLNLLYEDLYQSDKITNKHKIDTHNIDSKQVLIEILKIIDN